MHRQQQFSDTTNIKHTTTLMLLACDMIVLRFLLIVFLHCFFCAKGAFFEYFFLSKATLKFQIYVCTKVYLSEIIFFRKVIFSAAIGDRGRIFYVYSFEKE